MAAAKTHPSVLIIGAGFGGIAQAIELRRHGITDVTILEAADGVGGTWRFNTYPGAACDIPSQMYSFSFAQRRDWSRPCSPQPEILSYLEGVAADHGITPLVVTKAPVDRCDWDAGSATWTATLADGRTYTADLLISATGQLNHPVNARVRGLDDFAGIQFHSARWRHDVDLTGKRVAVIGTGASAVQLVPEVAKVARHLDVYQRTGNWFMPRWNNPYPERYIWAIKHVPGLQRLRRWWIFEVTESITRAIRNPNTLGPIARGMSTAFMRWQLRGDAELRRKVWPNYTWGCKRVLFTSRFIPALRRPNVDLVTDAIDEVVPTGIRTADGTVRPVDVIIHGTGFASTNFMLPTQIAGEGGRTLEETWAQTGPHAHYGMTVPGSRTSSCSTARTRTPRAARSSCTSRRRPPTCGRRSSCSLARGRRRSRCAARWPMPADRALQPRFDGTAWLDCDSWYRDQTGRIVTNWPGYVSEYLAAVKTLDAADFALTPAAAPQPA